MDGVASNFSNRIARSSRWNYNLTRCRKKKKERNLQQGVNMNCANVLTGVLRRGVKPLFATSSGLLAQHTRNTYIFRRTNPVPLHKKNGRPARLRPRHMIYEVVENTEMKKHTPIDIILMDYVAGVGNKGERLSVRPIQAYNRYLLTGLAVYASPDNLKKYKDMIDVAKSEMPEYSSRWVPRAMNILSSHLLGVVVNQNNPWSLQKFHIRAAFRKVNIHVPDHAITLPEREITGPDLEKENKEFYVTVTINKREQVKVRCRLHHYTNKESEKIPSFEYWKKPAEAIFPEDQPILDSLKRLKVWNKKDAASAV